jgi:hypothetical protein
MPFISRVRRLLSSLAKDRSKDAWDELAMRPIRDAAQAPEFTADTIRADPWTAVYLPIPPDADAALLQQVREAMTLCRETVEGPP